jgi:DNA-binding HxlR family transcriptional regulator
VRYNTPNPIRPSDSVEWLILDLLLERPRPWRVGEIVDEIGSTVAVAEALEVLQVAGLIERTDAFVRIAPM